MKTPIAKRFYEYYVGHRGPPKGKVTREQKFRFTFRQRFSDGSELIWWLNTPRIGWKHQKRWMAVGKPIVLRGAKPNDRTSALSPRNNSSIQARFADPAVVQDFVPPRL